MGIVPRFKCVDRKGKLIVIKDHHFRDYLKKLEKHNFLALTVEPWEKKGSRSLQQLRYYRGVVLRILEEAGPGYTADEWHEVLCGMFLKEYKEFKGQEIIIVKSTSSLDTQEMEEYLRKVREFASREGMYIPLPNEACY